MQQPGLARLAALAAWVLLGQPLTLPLNIKGHGSAWLVARALAKHAHQPRLPLFPAFKSEGGSSRFCFPPAQPEQK